jgi:integrase
LRAGEINHLIWEDVHWDIDEIEVAPKVRTETTVAWNPKDNERRIVPLTAGMKIILQELKASADEDNPYVFVSGPRYKYILAHVSTWPEDKPLVNNLRRDFRKLCAAAGVPIGEFHALRKSCCTNLLEGRVAPHAVQKIMGHASLETTIRYYSQVRRDQVAMARECQKLTRVVVKYHQTPVRRRLHDLHKRGTFWGTL